MTVDRRTLLFEITVLALAATLALVLFALGARLISRYDALQARHTADSVRWQSVLDRCDMNSAGEVHCPVGVFATSTSTTTSTTIKEAR